MAVVCTWVTVTRVTGVCLHPQYRSFQYRDLDVALCPQEVPPLPYDATGIAC